jgi:RNA polymerase sigma-70 factor (ECF subfamily)
MSTTLMIRAQAGDADAFGELYAAYVGEVRRYAETRHPGHGDDIAQDVFVRALGALHSWRDQGKTPGAWLRTITANLCRDRARSAHYLRSTVVDFTENTDFRTLRDTHREGDPEGAVLDRARDTALLTALWALTADQRECLLNRYVRELTVEETAESMGVTVGAVKSTRSLAAYLSAGWAW